MKLYTEDQIIDKYIGKKGTPKRKKFDADVLRLVKRLKQQGKKTTDSLLRYKGILLGTAGELLF